MSSTLPTRKSATRAHGYPASMPATGLCAWRNHRPHDIPGHEPEVPFVPGPYLLLACRVPAREPDAVDLRHLAVAVALRRAGEHPDAVNQQPLWGGGANARRVT